jgi:hypothetical protein
LPLKAKKLKALACVLGVLFSVIIALTVLQLVSHIHLPGSDVTEGDLHNRTCKNTSTTPKKDHLPKRLTQPKDSRCDRYTSKREDKHWFPANPIGGPTPLKHQQHLRE